MIPVTFTLFCKSKVESVNYFILENQRFPIEVK